MMIKEQTQLGSFIEASTNIAIGFFISFAGYLWVIGPIYNIPVTPVDSLGVTIFFTVTSLARSYFVRRAFNYRRKK